MKTVCLLSFYYFSSPTPPRPHPRLPRVAFPVRSAATSLMNPHDNLPTASICLLSDASTLYELRLGCHILAHVLNSTWAGRHERNSPRLLVQRDGYTIQVDLKNGKEKRIGSGGWGGWGGMNVIRLHRNDLKSCKFMTEFLSFF